MIPTTWGCQGIAEKNKLWKSAWLAAQRSADRLLGHGGLAGLQVDHR